MKGLGRDKEVISIDKGAVLKSVLRFVYYLILLIIIKIVVSHL